jgi:hypothetical protein
MSSLMPRFTEGSPADEWQEALPIMNVSRGGRVMQWQIDDTVRRAQFGLEPELVSASVGPFPLGHALARLRHQSELATAAKLALSRAREAQILAEVQCNGDRQHAQQLAAAALEHALAWFTAGADGERPEQARQARATMHAPATLAPVTKSEPSDELPGMPEVAAFGRVFSHQFPDGTLRLSAPAAAIRLADASAGRALALFALEANARLRLTRLSVSACGDGMARVTWEIVLLREQSSEASRSIAIEALAVARAETERALRALGSPSVARAYLRARDSPENQRQIAETG